LQSKLTAIKMGNTLNFHFSSKQDIYYQRYLNILNILLPKKLTDKEIQILSMILQLSFENQIGKQQRKILYKELGITESNLINYLNGLIRKGFIKKEEDVYILKKFVIPQDRNSTTFVIKIEMEKA
jgi:DNA-binding MarR family transcriptional regulator